MTAVNEISGVQTIATEATKKATNKLLNYAATYPDTILRFYASDMILYIESDAAYLVQPQARSRMAGFFHLSTKIPPNTHPNPPLNGPFHIECKTIRNVVASAAKAETNGLFHNAREAIPIRQTLIAMGHPQPLTPIKTDNSTALQFVQSNIKQKKSKSWDMRLNWLQDKETIDKMFHFYWKPGSENIADYHTKHHPPKHHLNVRHKYVHDRKHHKQKDTLALCTQMIIRAARVC